MHKVAAPCGAPSKAVTVVCTKVEPGKGACSTSRTSRKSWSGIAPAAAIVVLDGCICMAMWALLGAPSVICNLSLGLQPKSNPALYAAVDAATLAHTLGPLTGLRGHKMPRVPLMNSAVAAIIYRWVDWWVVLLCCIVRGFGNPDLLGFCPRHTNVPRRANSSARSFSRRARLAREDRCGNMALHGSVMRPFAV